MNITCLHTSEVFYYGSYSAVKPTFMSTITFKKNLNIFLSTNNSKKKNIEQVKIIIIMLHNSDSGFVLKHYFILEATRVNKQVGNEITVQ